MRTTRAKSHLRQPDDITRSSVDKASSSLSVARKTIEIYEKQMDDRQATLEESRKPYSLRLREWKVLMKPSFFSEAQINELERKLRDKQRVAFLLDVLEQKEALRVRRFQEISKMLAGLRCGWVRFSAYVFI